MNLVEMEKPFYVHLSSEDSSEYFSDNDVGEFTVKLPEILQLHGDWEVALCALSMPKMRQKPNRVITCSDICGESIYGGKRLPLLRVSTGRIPTSFQPLQYVPIRLQHIERITVYIKSGSGETLSFQRGITSCTLHFKHV